MRILHAPTNVANQAWAMAQGLRRLGHEVQVWHFSPNAFDFPADRVIDVGDDPKIAVRTLIEALDADFDVFHFHLGRSLVRPVGGLPLLWDLPVLRALGKRIIFTFHGADIRHRALETDRWTLARFGDTPDKTEEIAKRLAVIRTYAQRLTVLSILNLPFVPEAEYIPKAIDLEDLPESAPPRTNRPIVVHAPSSRGRKGSEFVVPRLEELARGELDFELRVVDSLPHDQLLKVYADADVVVDNIIFGDYEVSTLEAMALGKPVVTRIRDEVRTAHPELPAVHADPDSFADAISSLLKDSAARGRLGERGRSYVKNHHAAEIVASKLVQIYEIDPHPVWRVFPDWTGLSSHRKLEDNEARIRELETKVRTLQRRLRDRESVVQDVRALYGDSKPVKILRELRRRRKKKG